MTPTQDAFMLACRDEVERNGVLFGNELRSRLSEVELPITPWSEDKVKRRQIKRLLTYNAGAYGLFFNDKVPKKKKWSLKLAVSPDEPPTTTIYSGTVARFTMPAGTARHRCSSSLCCFLQLDATENEVFMEGAAAPEGLKLGDRVEFRIVEDVNRTRRKGVVHYKAVDVSFEGATTDSEESLDEPGAAPTEASAEPPVAPDADAAGPARDETSIEPFRLALTRLRLITATDKARGFCADVAAKAERRGLRCEIDPGKHCLNKKIQRAEQQRVPIICVVGEQEASSGKLSVRARGRGDLGKIDVEVLLDMLGGVEDVDQLDTEAFEKPVAPDADASAGPAREAPIEEAPVARPLPTLLRLDADFCLELARELLRSEL